MVRSGPLEIELALLRGHKQKWGYLLSSETFLTIFRQFQLTSQIGYVKSFVISGVLPDAARKIGLKYIKSGVREKADGCSTAEMKDLSETVSISEKKL